MKKVLIILMALTLTYGSQAQIGGLVGGAIRKSVEKKVSQTVEDKMDSVLGNKKQQRGIELTTAEKKQATEGKEEAKLPTPEEIMDMVPMLPTYDNLADYACETNRANPRTLKIVANPTSKFVAKMTMALASGYVTMMGDGKGGNVYYYDEQLLKELGITQEKFDAMSEEEQTKLAQQYAAELQERYIHSVERLSEDPTYKKMQDKYYEIDQRIQKLFSEAEASNREMWISQYGNKGKATEEDMCAYFKAAVPTLYKAVNNAMKIRREEQLPIAKQMDEHVQIMAQKHPQEIFAGFFNNGGLCATAYVSDAARLTSFSDPR